MLPNVVKTDNKSLDRIKDVTTEKSVVTEIRLLTLYLDRGDV